MNGPIPQHREINALFLSDFDELSPFERETPTDDELAEHVNIFRGSVDFVMGLSDDQARYAKEWITALPFDWHNDRTDVLVRVCSSIRGYADSKPHPHLDTIPGQHLVHNYTNGGLKLEQIMSFDGVDSEVLGTTLYRGHCGLHVPSDTFTRLQTHCPWHFEVEEQVNKGTLTKHRLNARDRVLINNQTLHQAPLAVSNSRRIFLRARRKLSEHPIKHKNRLINEETEHIYGYGADGKIEAIRRKEVLASLGA